MASFPTFLFSGLFAVAILLILNVLFIWCRHRFRTPTEQTQVLQTNGALQQGQLPHRPAAWHEAVCIVNPDGSTQYAASAADMKGVEQEDAAPAAAAASAPPAPTVLLQPQRREEQFFRPGVGMTYM